MPTYVIPPDNRAVGTGNPPQDVNQLSDMEGLLAAVVAQAYGYTGNSVIPTSNAANVTALAGVLGASTRVIGATGWINVTLPPYNADPAGSADSTAAINSALTNAAVGQPVYAPTGVYKTTGPIVIPPAGNLIGDFANEVSTYLDYTLGTVIRPSSAWAPTSTWTGVVTVLGTTAGGYARKAEEQKITGITIDCHLIPGSSANGLQLYGDTSRTHMERINITHAPHNCFSTDPDTGGNGPGSFRLVRVNTRYAGNYGFNIVKCSDITAIDCLAENATSDGWNLTNLSNGMLIGCRSEHSGVSGAGNGLTYTCTNSNTGSGTTKLIAFSTDRNEGHGIQITSSNSSGVPVQLVGCQVRRDGRNNNTGGAGLAGIYVNAFPGTVLISGTAVFPGIDDDNSGANSPQYGLKLASNDGSRTYISASASYFQGNTAGINDDGSAAAVNYGTDALAAKGTTSSPVVAGPRQGNGNLTAGTQTVTCTSVTSTSRIFLTSTTNSASQGRLYISALNPGVSFTVSSSNGSDSTNFVWQIMNP